MNTNRFILRERTSELVNWIVEQPTKKQLEFFGYEDIELLNIELNRIEQSSKMDWFNFRKWDILKNDSGSVIGNCGFHNWEVKHERAELGYILHEKFRRQGYMTEAIPYIIDFGFQQMGLNRIEAFISPENLPSIKLITKFNFLEEGRLREHYKINNKIYDSLVFSLLKSDYTKNRALPNNS